MSSHELVRFSSFGRIGQKECVVGESSMEKSVVLREIDTRGIITKTKLPVGGLCCKPIRGVHAWMQVLLCFIHEEVQCAS